MRDMMIEAISEAVLEAMKDGDGRTRCFAAKALGRLKASDAIPALADYLKDEDPDVRGDVAVALGEIGDKRAVPFLIQSLNDEDGFVRLSAIEALGKLGDPLAVEALVDAMVHAPSFPFDMGEISWDYQWDIMERAAEALGMLKDKRGVDGLISILKDEDSDFMLDTVFCSLVRTGDRDALEAVAAYLKSPDPVIRRKAVGAFNYTETKDALSYLTEALIDDDSIVKLNAIEVIGRLGGEREVIPLVLLLKDEDSDVRVKAAEAICRPGGVGVAKHILPLLKDPSRKVREKVIGLLADIKGEGVVEGLVDLLGDEDERVVGEAVIALSKVGDDRAVSPLIFLFEDKERSGDLRCKALFALGEISSPEALNKVIDVLMDREEDDWVREMALRILPVFGKEGLFEKADGLLKDGDEVVRQGIVRILKSYNCPKSEAILSNLLNDDFESVRREAAISIAFTGSDKGMPLLASLMTSFLSAQERCEFMEEVCNALKEVRNDEAKALLLKGLRSENPLLRYFSVRAIGEMGDKGLVDEVLNLLTDENRDVRREAVTALGVLGDGRGLTPLLSSLYDYERFNNLRMEIIDACKRIDRGQSLEVLVDILKDKKRKDNHWTAIEALEGFYKDIG